MIDRQPSRKTKKSVELATLEWVAWFNHHRLLEPIGNVPPTEAEATYYRQIAESPATARFTNEPPRFAGRFNKLR